MEEQSYAKHAKLVPLFHFTLLPLNLLTLIGAIVNLVIAINRGEGRRVAVLLVTLSVAVGIASVFARVFALKAQDRAIRAEEKLRHFILTGKPLDPRLTIQQIVGLRFASDSEFPELARRAAEENLSLDAVKRAVKTWRPDHDRL